MKYFALAFLLLCSTANAQPADDAAKLCSEAERLSDGGGLNTMQDQQIRSLVCQLSAASASQDAMPVCRQAIKNAVDILRTRRGAADVNVTCDALNHPVPD